MKLVERLAEAQNWRCAYCQEVMELGEATRDHVIPRSEGGESGWHNEVAACEACNKIKSSKNAYNFYAFVQIYGRDRARKPKKWKFYACRARKRAVSLGLLEAS